MIDTDREKAAQKAAILQLAWLFDGMDTEGFAAAEHGGKRWLGLVLKRTYQIRDGRCELAGPDEQELLQEDEAPYDDELETPRVSPPICVNDAQILKARTDVVVQALAYAPTPNTRKLSASVRFGKHEREIVVFGDRVGEFDRMGRPRFSEPEPIEAVPVRYDFAYGGPDLCALARSEDPMRKILQEARSGEDWLAVTDYHYPRNPCGLGYLIELDNESFEGLPIPNLEYPFDPLSPARLAVGDPRRWVKGPLPAGWDWQSETWFPRLGLVGMAPSVEDPSEIPAESRRGWAPKDILSIPPIHQNPDKPLRLEYFQAASPGMSVDDLSPGETFVLKNLHPSRSKIVFRLPSERPRVKLELSAGALTELAIHLDAVVVRPDPGEVVMVWSARVVTALTYTQDQLANMKREVEWLAQKEA